MIFTNIIKPTHRCNLACRYCFNEDIREPIMSISVLERIISETFDYVRSHFPDRWVNFVWHGGEPMLAGIDFYEHALACQQRDAGDLRYTNTIQTNGMAINDRWLAFFKRSGMSISISIDGAKESHDAIRIDRKGNGSFDQVDAAIERLSEQGIPAGLCGVLSQANKDHLDDLYDYALARGLGFNIIPLMRAGEANGCYGELGLGPEEYADYYLPLYDRWFDADQDYAHCSDFVFKTRAVLAGRPADCIGADRCAENNISVDPIGDVFPCASLSGKSELRYGNIMDAGLDNLMQTDRALAHRARPIDPQCAECKWQHICNGGCPARSQKFFDDYHRREYYCPSLFRIYEHIESRLAEALGSTQLPLENEAHPNLAHAQQP